MIQFVFIAASILTAFSLGVWLAPVVRGDYAEFKSYVENKLKVAEQSAKDKL